MIAILLTTGGTAFAAFVVTGVNIKNGTLTSADLKPGTLLPTDFSATGRQLMRGSKGLAGPSGQPGVKGPTGDQGPQGDKGNAAHVASKWSWWESRYVVPASDGSNATPNNWYQYNTGFPADVAPEGNTNQLVKTFANPVNRAYETVLDLNSPGCALGQVQGTSCPYGANDGGGVTTSWNSNLTAVAHLNVMYSQTDDTNAGVTPPHVRLNCQLQANDGTSGSDFSPVGAKSSFSGFRDRQIETVTLVGSINRTTSTPKTYLVQVQCRDADGTGTRNRFWILGGSMSVVATERG